MPFYDSRILHYPVINQNVCFKSRKRDNRRNQPHCSVRLPTSQFRGERVLLTDVKMRYKLQCLLTFVVFGRFHVRFDRKKIKRGRIDFEEKNSNTFLNLITGVFFLLAKRHVYSLKNVSTRPSSCGGLPNGKKRKQEIAWGDFFPSFLW